MSADSDLAATLAARTRELVDIPSVSRDEAEIARYVANAVPLEPLYHEGYSLVYAVDDGGRPVLLAGHLDTVPAQENLPGRLEDDWVVGLGASDMKGGVAVMVELARWLAAERPATVAPVAFLFFPREELPADESPLPGLLDTVPRLAEAQLAVVLEPTDNTLQLGCLGNVNATLVFHGESAHSARPWLGVNAIERAVEALRGVAALEPEPVVVGGLEFVEVLSLTGISGGIASNVIPDRAEARVNYRYAPSRTPADAEARVRELAAGADEVVVESNSGPARVPADSPLVARLREAGDFALEPKQAWTPVAQFSERGLDAVNLGPGATRYAHRRDERVAIPELVRTFQALQRFLTVTV